MCRCVVRTRTCKLLNCETEKDKCHGQEAGWKTSQYWQVTDRAVADHELGKVESAVVRASEKSKEHANRNQKWRYEIVAQAR